ncbi:MAG: FG-GAP-like repeat-containing protein, partial [bacterium]
GDYDKDGDLDILLTGNGVSNPISKIYRNYSGSFVDISALLPGVSWGSVAWGDYDNDGDLDILLTGNGVSNPISKIYRNDGGGSFIDIAASITEPQLGCAAWGDYDNDGDLDILLTSISGNSKVYRNDNGSFVDISASLPRVNNSSAAWGDYDNDGDLDILLTGDPFASDYISKIYRNDGGSFVDISATLPGVSSGSVAWGDYDNDGDLDILLTGWDYTGDRISKIYRNNITTVNTVPTAPSNLISSVTGSSVTLSLDKSTDNQTSQNALTYNLRIGTTSGGSQIMSPMSNIGNGYRKVTQIGNTNHNNSWTIGNLADGTYYWSVQAIDNAFAGSAFATEQSFIIGGDNTSPSTITNLSVSTTTSTSINLSWTSPGDDGDQGTATTYDSRYSTSTITSENWSSATQATGEPSPQQAGTTETFTVTGLSQNTTYYFAIKTADEVPNWSGLSNIVSTTTNSLYDDPGYAISLDGSDYVHIPQDAVLQTRNSMTIEAWIRCENPNSDQQIYCENNGSDNHIELSLRSAGVRFAHERWYFDTGSGIIQANQWTHIAGVFDSETAAGKVYINGSLVSATTTGDGGLNPNTLDVAIGSFSDGNYPGFKFKGQIDEVRHWNTVRTASQIQSSYNHCVNKSDPNLVGYWKFDNNADDSTSNGNHGTLMGDPIYVQSTAPINGFSDTESASVSTQITFNEGGSEPGDGHSVQMNFASLTGSGNVTVLQTNTAPTYAPCINVCGYYLDISKDESITAFSTDITFHYTDTDVSGYTESSAYLGISRYNNATNTWQWLGGIVDAANNKITVSGVTSFSTFALYRRIFGDITGDGYVDAADLQHLGDVWHQTNSGEFTAGTDARFFNYNKNTDANENQIIDAADLQVFGDSWHNGVVP